MSSGRVSLISNCVKRFSKTQLWIYSTRDRSPERLSELLLSGSEHQDFHDSHNSLHHSSSIPNHIPPPLLLCILNVAQQARLPALHSHFG